MKIARMTAICFFIAILTPITASADVPDAFREYVTYGSFNVIVSAFERVSLMMSDTSFGTYAFAALLLSVGIWAAGGFTALIGARNLGSWLRGIVIIFIGAIMYMVFIVPKTDLLVYDETTNRNMVVSDVPEGLVLLAGIQNAFVRGAVNMIWTSTDPLSYRQNAHGDIYNVMSHVFANKSFVPSTDDSSGKNLSLSIQSYFKDCVLFELSRPGTGLNTNDFISNRSILDIMAQARTPSKATVFYDQTNPAGYTCSCEDSFNNIDMALGVMAENSGTNAKFWTERCEEAGYFDYTGSSGLPANEICRKKVVDFLSYYFTPGDSLNLMKQHLVSSEIFNYIKLNDVQALTDFKVMTAIRGQATAANTWLPVLKSVVFAIYLGLTPFIFLLLPSTVFPRVLQFFFGIFVFMASWEICDAILHSHAMDASIAAFREIVNNGLSLKSLWMMEGESIRAAMSFGKFRWASMILATGLSAILARFGGLAMAHVANMMHPGVHGADAANDMLQPDRRASKLNSLPGTAPTEAITNEHGWDQLQDQGYLHQKGSIVGNTMIIQGHGGATPSGNVSGQMTDFGFSDREQRMLAHQDMADANNTPVTEGLYLPHRSSAERGYAGATVDTIDDYGLTRSSAAHGSLSEKANFIKNKALEDITHDGNISDSTQNGINAIRGHEDGQMALANTPSATTNMNPAQKTNLQSWLRDNGYNVGRIGSQATVNYAVDKDGELVPSGISTFEGHSGSGGMHFRDTRGESVDIAITPENPLMVNQNGENIEFIRGRITGYQGGYFNISDGVTGDGQLINGMIGGDGQFIKESHPAPLEVSSASMLNLLSNNKLPDSQMNVLDNQGVAVQSWVEAVRTYAQKSGIDSGAWDFAIKGYGDGYVGTPVGSIVGSGARAGISTSGGHSWQWSDQEITNMLSDDIRQKISGASTNQEALGMMQESYNNIMGDLSEAHDKMMELPDSKSTLSGSSQFHEAHEIMKRQIDKHGMGD